MAVVNTNLNNVITYPEVRRIVWGFDHEVLHVPLPPTFKDCVFVHNLQKILMNPAQREHGLVLPIQKFKKNRDIYNATARIVHHYLQTKRSISMLLLVNKGISLKSPLTRKADFLNSEAQCLLEYLQIPLTQERGQLAYFKQLMGCVITRHLNTLSLEQQFQFAGRLSLGRLENATHKIQAIFLRLLPILKYGLDLGFAAGFFAMSYKLIDSPKLLFLVGSAVIICFISGRFALEFFGNRLKERPLYPQIIQRWNRRVLELFPQSLPSRTTY